MPPLYPHHQAHPILLRMPLSWLHVTAHAQDELLRLYTACTVWADWGLADRLSTASEPRWEQEVPSSFHTLRKTALHI